MIISLSTFSTFFYWCMRRIVLDEKCANRFYWKLNPCFVLYKVLYILQGAESNSSERILLPQIIELTILTRDICTSTACKSTLLRSRLYGNYLKCNMWACQVVWLMLDLFLGLSLHVLQSTQLNFNSEQNDNLINTFFLE